MDVEDPPRTTGSEPQGDAPKESRWSWWDWWKKFGEWLTLVLAILTAAGVILKQGNDQGDEIRELRKQVGELRVEVAKLQAADTKSHDRVTRATTDLMRWTRDEFSDICDVLGGKYRPSEQYCELKERSLKYHPLHLE